MNAARRLRARESVPKALDPRLQRETPMTPLFPLLVGCAATIQVAAQPDSARVYVTDYPAMTSKPPQITPRIAQVDAPATA